MNFALFVVQNMKQVLPSECSGSIFTTQDTKSTTAASRMGSRRDAETQGVEGRKLGTYNAESCVDSTFLPSYVLVFSLSIPASLRLCVRHDPLFPTAGGHSHKKDCISPSREGRQEDRELKCLSFAILASLREITLPFGGLR